MPSQNYDFHFNFGVRKKLQKRLTFCQEDIVPCRRRQVQELGNGKNYLQIAETATVHLLKFGTKFIMLVKVEMSFFS